MATIKTLCIMKIALSIFLIVLLQSCTPSKEEVAIANFVQTIGDTKTDMNFELISLDYKGDVSGMDSVKIILRKESSDTTIGAKDYIIQLSRRAHRLDSTVNSYRDKADAIGTLRDNFNVRLLMGYMKLIDDLKPVRAENKNLLTQLTKHYNDSGKILAKKYEATYSIQNPFMNNAEQEIKRIFYLTPDAQRVITTE